MASLWGGRFEKDMDELVKKYNASIFFDQRMYNEDIDGSIAHVTMLAKQGIVTEGERDQIIAGLESIRKDIAAGKIVFTVEDEGPGIPPEAQKHIFDKFYQGDSSHREEGNGLGLALVKRILNVCGGEIAQENLPGRGCRFTVRLPEN